MLSGETEFYSEVSDRYHPATRLISYNFFGSIKTQSFISLEDLESWKSLISDIGCIGKDTRISAKSNNKLFCTKTPTTV